MRTRHWKLFVLLGSLLIVSAYAFHLWAKRGYHRAAIIVNQNSLMVLYGDWQKAGRLNPQLFLNQTGAKPGTFVPFVFETNIVINGVAYKCIFGTKNARFSESGVLAVAETGDVLWVGGIENRIVSSAGP